MNRTEFFNKLLPFFSMNEVARLEEDAFESFADAHGYSPATFDEKAMAYEFECVMLFDYSGSLEDFNSVFTSVIGSEYTQEDFDALTAQMDVEW